MDSSLQQINAAAYGFHFFFFIQHKACANDTAYCGCILRPNYLSFRACESGKYFFHSMGKDTTPETQSLWIFSFCWLMKVLIEQERKPQTFSSQLWRIQGMCKLSEVDFLDSEVDFLVACDSGACHEYSRLWVLFLVFWKGSRQLCIQNRKSLSAEQRRLRGPGIKNKYAALPQQNK